MAKKQSAAYWRKQWWLYSVGGLITLGFGLSLLGEAIILKAQGGAWFSWGTLALVVVNSGVALVGQAVFCKVQAQRRSETKPG